ncbi:MAG: phospholipase D family protein [Pseudomonadota bacterium]
MKPVLILILALITGCAGVDYQQTKPASIYIPAGNTAALDLAFSESDSGHGTNSSGFLLLNDGIDALAARLRLAAEAERSIDVQYYLIKRDRVGLAFLSTLLAAADRGVRVRILIDDMFNQGFDRDMAALDSHPDLEIRVFNPFNRGILGKPLGALANFPRINRRMHNKSFTVDSRVTVVGGRNIADEYFGARRDSAFGDLDVLALGPVVQDVNVMFDRYWAHPTALPLDAFMKPLEDAEAALGEFRARLAANNAALSGSRYANAVIERAYRKVESRQSEMVWADYELIFDTPDKGLRNRAKTSDLIVKPLARSLTTVENELVVISPYFVPTRELRDGLVRASENGIQVTVITNSLAANNQKTVHGGYAPARKPLLRAGVRLLEVRPDAVVSGSEFVDAGEARSTLHTKAYLVDRREVFIGSFNFDPRSMYINSEMGVIIRDPDLGAELISGLEEALPEAVWEVGLTHSNRLTWTGLEEGQEQMISKEPMTSWWERLKAGFYRILPIRSQL